LAAYSSLLKKLINLVGSARKRAGRYYTRLPAGRRRSVGSLRRNIGERLRYGRKYASVMGRRRIRQARSHIGGYIAYGRSPQRRKKRRIL